MVRCFFVPGEPRRYPSGSPSRRHNRACSQFSRTRSRHTRIRIVHDATKGASIGRPFEIASESLVHAAQTRTSPDMLAPNSGHDRLRWANLLGCRERNRRSRDNNALNRSDISRRGRLVPRMVGFANFTIHSTHKFKPFPSLG